MAFYSEIEDIKDVFFEKDIPEWELYNGKVKNKPNPELKWKSRIDFSDNADMTASYQKLEDVLNRISLKNGNVMLFIGPIDETPRLAIPITLSRKTMTRETQQGSTVSGINAYRGVGETLEDKMKIYDLNRRLSDMENSSEGSFIERIGERVIDMIDPQLLGVAINAILGKMAGAQTPNSQTVPMAANQAVTGQQSNDRIETSIDKLVDVLSQNFDSETEMADFIDKMTTTVQNNPAIIKNLS